MDLKPRRCIDKIAPYIAGKTQSQAKALVKNSSVGAYVKLSSNESPLGASVDLADIVNEELLFRYPDIRSSGLTKAIAERFNVSQGSVILGNGSDEILQLLCFAYLNPGDEVVSSLQTFSIYKLTTQLFDGRYKAIPLNEDNHDLSEIIKTVTKKTKLVFLANPNNPTGRYLTHSDVSHLLENCPKTTLIVLDEAYGEYADAEDFPDAFELMKHHKNLVVTRTFSKIYGLAGLRCGYGVAHENVINVLQKIRPPFNINNIALKACEKAIKNISFVQKAVALNSAQKKRLIEALMDLPVTIVPSQGNFLCYHCPVSGEAVANKLLEKGIIVRALTSFDLPNSIRVTIGTEEENTLFIEAFRNIVSKEVTHGG